MTKQIKFTTADKNIEFSSTISMVQNIDANSSKGLYTSGTLDDILKELFETGLVGIQYTIDKKIYQDLASFTISQEENLLIDEVLELQFVKDYVSAVITNYYDKVDRYGYQLIVTLDRPYLKIDEVIKGCSEMVVDNDVVKYENKNGFTSANLHKGISINVLRDDLEVNLYEFVEKYKNRERKHMRKKKVRNSDNDKKQKIRHSRFARELIDILDLHLYKNVIYYSVGQSAWECDPIELERLIRNQNDDVSSSDMREIIWHIGLELEEENVYDIIALNNGVYYDRSDYKLKKLSPGEEMHFTPIYMDIDIDVDNLDYVNEDVENYLKQVSTRIIMEEYEDENGKINMRDVVYYDSEVRQLINEFLGSVIMKDGKPEKAFMLFGREGANGKSTFMKMASAFVGSKNLSGIDIGDMEDPTSALEMNGKLLNAYDDIDPHIMDKPSVFKIAVSGGAVSKRGAYQKQTTRLDTSATQLFTMNSVPIFREKTNAIIRRLQFIPFEFRVSKRDPKIDYKLSSKDAKTYLFILAMAGVQQIIENGYELSKCKRADELLESEIHSNDSVHQFLYDHIGEENIFNRITKNRRIDIYTMYSKYCSKIGMHAKSLAMFSKDMYSKGFVDRKITIIENDKGEKLRVNVYWPPSHLCK